MRSIAVLLVTLLVTGCNLTPTEMRELNQMVGELNQSTQSFNQQATQMRQQVYDSEPPASLVPSAGSNQTRRYMINTPSGLQQKTCNKTKSGLVYCY
jgi:outer membrane murein-binding lipoprotein Lpp